MTLRDLRKRLQGRNITNEIFIVARDAITYAEHLEAERDDAVGMLRSVLGDGYLVSDPEEFDYCFFCGSPISYVKGDVAHHENCPWVSAQAFLARIDKEAER